jgi:hypothetical protein
MRHAIDEARLIALLEEYYRGASEDLDPALEAEAKQIVREVDAAVQGRYRRVPFTLIAALVLGGIIWSVLPGSGDLTPKGETDAFAVAVQHGASRRFAKPGETLFERDQLGFFYSASDAGALTIWNRDSQGRVDRLTEMREIAPGDQVPLADGAMAGPGRGCEWFIAVFSDRPLDRTAVEAAIERADPEGACSLRVAIPGARSVRVFDMNRGLP